MKFLDFLQEQKTKTVVLAFGRMNPITIGHEKLVNKVEEIAKEVHGSAHIVLSHTHDSTKNPLTPKEKLKFAKASFSGVNFSTSDESAPNFLSQATKLYNQGYTNLHMVGGSDRVAEYNKILKKYNGVKSNHGYFNFKTIEVHSAGERDPDAEGVEGMSGTKMRKAATEKDFTKFKSGVPSKMPENSAKQMYNAVRKGLNLHEDIDLDLDFESLLNEGVHDKSIFKAVFLAGGPGSGKDYVLSNTLDGHGLVEINSDKAFEFLMDKEGLSKTMPEDEKEKRNVIRGKAKNMTELRQRLALLGRNGLIINGTGDDAKKIAKIKSKLEELGYETSMILVNTDDEVSKQRNIERGQRGGRTVPENIRKEKWDAVQASRPEFAKLFGDKYSEFDNSEDLRTAAPEVVKQKKEEMLSLFKGVQSFVSEPPKNPSADNWIAQQMSQKDAMPVDKDGAEKTPHPDSAAAEEARKMGLKYYGFGRYGKNGKVTHRVVHDRLVDVQSSKSVNEEFEEYFVEDLRQWFNPSHPKGGWKRINSKGEAIGPCARKPGEPKPKCMSNEKRAALSKTERAAAVRAKRKHDPNPERKGKPINVSNFGKGKLSESYEFSDSNSLELLLLGKPIDAPEIVPTIEEEQKVKLLRDKNGKIRTFMLRSAAAKQAHTTNGVVLPYKNGYVIKIKEEKNDVKSFEENVRTESNRRTETPSVRSAISEGSGESGRLVAKTCGTGSSSSDSGASGNFSAGSRSGERDQTQAITETSSYEGRKITLSEIRKRQEEKIRESIDKNIEPGVSMAGAGESIARDMGEKIRKKDGKASPIAELTGDETTMSIGDQKENELKRKGISLQSFKAKKFVG
jgi:dephospho-CoA kinase